MSRLDKLKIPLIDIEILENVSSEIMNPDDTEPLGGLTDKNNAKARFTMETYWDLNSPTNKRRNYFIELKAGVSWWNVSNIFVTYFVSIGQITFFDLTLVYLLKSADYYQIPESDVATVTGNIIAYSQPFTLIFDLIIGVMHDKIGRRLTLFLTTLVCVATFLIIPHLDSVIPGLLIMRIMLNFSIKGPLIAPLAADYIQKSTRGRAVSLEGIGAGCGAVFSVFVLFGLTKNYDYMVSFTVAAMVFLFFAFYMLITVKEMTRVYSEDQVLSHSFSFSRIKEGWLIIYRMSRYNKRINLSYYGSFVARMGDVLYIVFISLWISDFYKTPEALENINDAKVRSQMISGIGGVIILLLSILVGWGSDRFPFRISVALWFGLRALFAFLIYLSTDVNSTFAFISLLMAYVFNGFVNVNIGSYFYKSIKPEFKGIINGIYLFFGTLGTILISKLGAYLFDYVNIGMPFLLGAIFDISFVLLIWIFDR